MGADPYTDPTTGEYVGEYERPCLLSAGEIHRDTGWFATRGEAQQFSRSGPSEATS